MEGMKPFFPQLDRAKRLRTALMDRRAAEQALLSKDTADDQLEGLWRDYWKAQNEIDQLDFERKYPMEVKE